MDLLEYYSQKELAKRYIELSKYREVVPAFEDSFGKRPDTINYEGDFNHFVKQGAVSFHGSVELWENPLRIEYMDDLDSLRKGWDLIIDIDCDENLKLAKKTALRLIEEFNAFGLEPGIKFSGNRGFH